MLAGILFMDKSGERHSIMYLQFFNPISNGKRYSWGSAALSWLYRHLCKASEKEAKQIGGAVLLVQLWAWERFPYICPMMRHPHQALPPGPLAIRWKGAKITTEHPMHVLRAYRLSLTSLRPNQYYTGGGSFVLQHDLPLPQTHQQPNHPGLREEKNDYEPPMDTDQGSATPLSDSKPQSPPSLSYPP
ncbi:serine/threonine-protein phosphatase 7 long form like protein [Quercus suber]|uniref:Serine/threonine-protein phosphatase 7 long form like protein n=1 Tax=Quercus suber TaxID=58331 RepID=A0AAW0MBW7_QUESU